MSVRTLGKTAADVQAIVDRSPYLSWLGIEVLSLGDDTIEAKARWRPEWVANPGIGQTQGGIHAALIDFAANFALMNSIGRPVLTIDLRVDYHRIAIKGDLVARGRVIRLGKQVSSCEASIFDEAGRLLASGRGSFLTAPPEEAKPG
ncbi:PaaI family thioesterase [Ancylobacter mangrovi]|uniref:PaaI family thioesterase n=1 Tax=Ancylobacter mangrovi TaxID=2972472 RepID=A0A9X2PJJ1_9HYPH|nr:PaaI family thioesterase [Ancylobacter mangrovi]MCS0497250.1 PaaI family thioesterase [Ancylobacter mangrovi]MCS0505075.1 PaaI family thioesterase [Ancylobacter mangrovi]